jgi:hypothetical protein
MLIALSSGIIGIASYQIWLTSQQTKPVSVGIAEKYDDL